MPSPVLFCSVLFCSVLLIPSGLLAAGVDESGLTITKNPPASASAWSVGPETDPGQLADILHQIKHNRLRFLFDSPCPVFEGANFHFVHTARGRLSFQIRDLVLPGRIPVVLNRIYLSSDSGEGSALGPGWRLGYDEYLVEKRDEIALHRPGGKILTWRRIQDGYTLSPPQPTDFTPPVREAGDVIRLASPDGWTRLFQQTGRIHRLALIRDPSGNEVRLSWVNGRLGRVEQSGGAWMELAYTSRGFLETVHDGYGRSIRYRYDGQGRLCGHVDRAGGEWVYRYGTEGLKAVVSSGGRVLLEVAYNQAARVKRLVDEDGREYRFAYDDTATRVWDPINRVTEFRHNSAGILVGVLNAEEGETSIVLDEANRVREYRMAGYTLARYAYHPDGTIREIEIPGRGRYSYEYDDAGRLALIAYPDGAFYRLERGAEERSFRVVTAEGVRSEMRRNETGDIVEYWPGGPSRFQLDFDETGRTIALADADGNWMEKIYDGNGRLNSVFLSDGRTIAVTENDAGRIVRTEGDDSPEISREYDLDGRLEQSVTLVGKQAFEIAPAGDDPAELAVDVNGRESFRFGFDAVGNVVSSDLARNTTKFLYDRTDRLIGAESNGEVRFFHAGGFFESIPPARRQPPRPPVGLQLDGGEIAAPGWMLELEALVQPQWRGVYFDESAATFRVAFPMPEECLWALGPELGRFVRRTRRSMDQPAGIPGNAADALLIRRPPELRDTDSLPTLSPMSGTTCICYYDIYGQIFGCVNNEYDCETYTLIYIPPFFPPDEPEPPRCGALILGGLNQYASVGNLKTFQAVCTPSGSVFPYWTVYRGIQPICTTTVRLQFFSFVFPASGEYWVVAHRGAPCDPFSVKVNAIRVDLQCTDVPGSPFPIDIDPAASDSARRRNMLLQTTPAVKNLRISEIRKIRRPTEDCGHIHAINNTLPNCRGLTSVDSGYTDAAGKFPFYYQGPIAAGDVDMTVVYNFPNDSATYSIPVLFESRHIGLTEFLGSNGCILWGDKPIHPLNHYATLQTTSAIANICTIFWANWGGEKIFVNDMSLEWGGLFDFQNPWMPPHSQHKSGKNADIYPADPTPPKWEYIKTLIYTLGFDLGDEIHTERPHIHFIQD